MVGQNTLGAGRRNILSALALILLCVISYGNTLGNGFLLDDHIFLLGQNTLKNVSLETLFFEGFQTTYRPIVLTFLKFELILFGNNQAGYHIVNIILFFAVCYLFFWILKKLTSNFYISFFSVCFFASHPINNFLINYKTAGCLSLYVLLMQVAFLLYIFYLDKKGRCLYVASLLAYFLSMLAHEITFILPVYLFLLSFLLKKYDFRKSVLLCLPYLLPFFLFLFIRMNVIHANTITSVFGLKISLGQYIASLYKLIWWYNSKIFYPKDILFIWDEKVVEQSINAPIIFTILILFCIWIVSIVRGRGSLKAFAFNFYLIGFIPMIFSSFTFTRITKTAMIEPHWFVFPSIGIFLLFVLLLFDVQKILKRRKIFFASIFLITIVLSLMTRRSNAVWKDDETYCAYWMQHNTLNGAAYNCRAKAYIRENDKGLELQKYQNCREVADIAGTYHIIGEEEKSLKYYLMALKKNSKCVDAFYGLGNLYMDIGNDKMAEGAFHTIIAIDPNVQAAYIQLIKIYEKQGKVNEAEKLLQMLRANRANR